MDDSIVHGNIRLPDSIDDETVSLLYEVACCEARESFWAYRQFVNQRMILGWWQREVAAVLEKFYCDMVAGKKPVLLLQAPPQHGKSIQVIDFVSWVAGKNPDLSTIFASFSDRLGVRANLRLQRTLSSSVYGDVFPDTKMSDSNVVTMAGRTLRNHEIVEYVGRSGSFRNTTVNGSITGESLDLGVIDDPIKGRAESMSASMRDKTWMWFTDDFFTRFSEKAGLLLIMTRWHVDDPAGRLIEEFGDKLSVRRYPAIAEKDERYRLTGEPLFPEHKSLDFLLKRRSVMTQSSWESVYQQSPIVVGGGLFPIERIGFVDDSPRLSEVKRSVRYWDKAGTRGGGAYTAGVLINVLYDGRVVVEDVQRGQWEALERERKIRRTAEIDGVGRRIETWVEREPGSGGKESAENTVRMLHGFNVKIDNVSGQGSKYIRAEPFAAQVQAGNVWLVRGQWNRAYLSELEVFDSGPYKDQVDASSGAYNKCVLGSSYDVSQRWAV